MYLVICFSINLSTYLYVVGSVFLFVCMCVGFFGGVVVFGVVFCFFVISIYYRISMFVIMKLTNLLADGVSFLQSCTY